MDYKLIRSRRLTLSLQVKNGEVIVRAPLKTSRKAINDFVESHSAWIEKQLKKEKDAKKAAQAVQKLSKEEINALALEAREYFPPVVRRYAARMGLEYGRVTIRCQK